MDNKRLDYLDFAKGIGIIFVLIGHTFFIPKYLQGYIYSFHMPLFFVLSGFVFSTKYPFKVFLKKKTKTLLLPFVSVIPLYVIYFTLVDFIKKDKLNLLSKITGLFFQRTGYVYAPWFFVVLFFTEIAFYLIVKITKNRKQALIPIVLLITAMGIIYFKTLNYHVLWQLQILFVSVPFFALGYLFKELNAVQKANKIPVILFMFLLSLAMFAVKCYYFEIYTSLTSNNYGNFAVFYSIAISATVFVILLSKRINYVKPINYLGKNTVVLFSLQQVLVSKPIKLALNSLCSQEQLNSFNEFQKLFLSLTEFAVTLAILLAVNLFVNKTPLRVLIGKPLKNNQ